MKTTGQKWQEEGDCRLSKESVMRTLLLGLLQNKLDFSKKEHQENLIWFNSMSLSRSCRRHKREYLSLRCWKDKEETRGRKSYSKTVNQVINSYFSCEVSVGQVQRWSVFSHGSRLKSENKQPKESKRVVSWAIHSVESERCRRWKQRRSWR